MAEHFRASRSKAPRAIRGPVGARGATGLSFEMSLDVLEGRRRDGFAVKLGGICLRMLQLPLGGTP
eukprot:3438004-Pyramimonas_sp.AAC.1